MKYLENIFHFVKNLTAKRLLHLSRATCSIRFVLQNAVQLASLANGKAVCSKESLIKGPDVSRLSREREGITSKDVNGSLIGWLPPHV